MGATTPIPNEPIDFVGCRWLLPRPTLFDDSNQLLRDVEAEPIFPTIFEPVSEFLAGIVIKHIHI